MYSRPLKFVAAGLALCFAAAPAAAQRDNASDVTGPNVTSSAIVSGFVTPSPTVSLPAGSAAALAAAASTLAASLNAGSVSGGGLSVSGPGVRSVGVLMTGPTTPSLATQAEVSAALSGGDASAVAVDALENSLAGLINNPTPANVTVAANAFALVVNQSGAAFLARPPEEFEAIYASLYNLVSAAYAGRR
jgi:hypothetical protein